MRYRLSPQARDDLIDLTRYGLERFGEHQAQRYLDGLFHVFELLGDMSGIGRSVPDLGHDVHRFEHGRHSIFYVARGDHVEIIRLIENRRDMRLAFGIKDDG